MLSDKVPEMAVGTGIKVLEREGYISRSHDRVGQAYIKVKSEKLKVESQKFKSKSQRNNLEQLINKYGDELEKGMYASLEEMADILKVKKDTLARLIKKLKELELAEYVPPFRGTEIKILKRVEGNEVKLDFAALKHKLKHAYKKLDLMENYIYHFGCRQKYILDYFGELEADKCAKCDNCLVKNMGEVEKVQVEEKHKKKTSSLSTKLTQLETLELWNKGLSLEKIAEARELTIDTIVGHLCFLIEKGLGISIDKLVKPERQKKIVAAIKTAGTDKLTPIHEILGEDYSWDEIKLVLAKMKSKK
jgi:ATP-dependent DNA helicase RecQ